MVKLLSKYFTLILIYYLSKNSINFIISYNSLFKNNKLSLYNKLLINNKKNTKLIHNALKSSIVPPKNIADDKQDKEPKYIECIIEYYSNTNMDISIESWMFNVNALIENVNMYTPSFLRFLILNSYILGRTKSISCTSWDKIIYDKCIECVKLLVGNVYENGIIVPVYDENNKTITVSECLNNRTNPFYKLNDIDVNNFCKTSIISFQ
jgi:hypothetical protein